MKVNSSTQIMNVSISLLLVVGIIYLLAFVMKKVKNNNLLNKDIKIESVAHLGNRAKLMIVTVMEHKMLLGVSNDSVNKICDLTED